MGIFHFLCFVCPSACMFLTVMGFSVGSWGWQWHLCFPQYIHVKDLFLTEKDMSDDFAFPSNRCYTPGQCHAWWTPQDSWQSFLRVPAEPCPEELASRNLPPLTFLWKDSAKSTPHFAFALLKLRLLIFLMHSPVSVPEQSRSFSTLSQSHCELSSLRGQEKS